jgi:hypothetical protein
MGQTKKDIERWNKETKMKKLISAAMERFDPEELLELMYEKCCNATQRDYLKDKMIDLTTFEGGLFIKMDSLKQQQRVSEFLETEIFPYHNERQSNLFTYA